MTFVYIIFAWLVLILIWTVVTWREEEEEEEQIFISKGGMKKYFDGRSKW